MGQANLWMLSSLSRTVRIEARTLSLFTIEEMLAKYHIKFTLYTYTHFRPPSLIKGTFVCCV